MPCDDIHAQEAHDLLACRPGCMRTGGAEAERLLEAQLAKRPVGHHRGANGIAHRIQGLGAIVPADGHRPVSTDGCQAYRTSSP